MSAGKKENKMLISFVLLMMHLRETKAGAFLLSKITFGVFVHIASGL